MPSNQEPSQIIDAPPLNIAGGLLRAMLLSPNVIVFMTDTEGILTYIDGTGLQGLGTKQSDCLHQRLTDFLPCTPAVQENIRKALDGTPLFTTLPIHNRYFELRLVPSFGPESKVTGLVGLCTDITEQHQVSEDLRIQKERLHNLFDSIPEISHVLDLELNIVMANRSSRNTFPGELIGLPCYKVVTGSDYPCPTCPVLVTYQTGEPTHIEWYDEQRDRHQALNCYPVRDSDGNIIGAVETASDITEKRKAQLALQKSEALLGNLFSCISDGIIVIDRDYTILRANRAMEQTHAQHLPLVGKKCYVTSRHDCVCPNCPAESMFQTEKPVTVEKYVELLGNKPSVWLDRTAHPLIDQTTAQVVGAICVIRDVTERKAIEIELKHYQTDLENLVDLRTRELAISEAKLRLILGTSSAAISFTDWQGNLIYVNDAYVNLFGYSPDELYGQSALMFSAGTDEDHQGFWNILEGKSDFNRITTSMRAKEGRIVWVDISASVIRGEDPTDTQLITILVDVTERQRFLEELRQARIVAEEASLAKSQFLSTMSHEMRTPLNGVIGLSDLLLETTLQPQQLEYAKLIKTSGNTLLYLINDILDLSKIEAGKFELENRTFDLHRVMESVSGILSAKAAEQNLALAVTFEPKVPRLMRGDEGRLRQVLINLVGNGLKFTKNGGVRVHVAAEEIRKADIVVRFEVTDTGIGIPEERLDRLFQPFSQVDASSARQYGGTGLGLAICKKLVELMGGTIGVQSVEGKGSTFWFNVTLECSPQILQCMSFPQPLCAANGWKACHWNQDNVRRGCGYPVGLDKESLKNVRALAVSANEVQRQALKTQLESWGLTTEVQSAPAVAWESLNTSRVRQHPYRLIFVDTDLEDGQGIDFINRIIHDDRMQNSVAIALMPLFANLETIEDSGERVLYLSTPLSCSLLFETVCAIVLEERFMTRTPLPNEMAFAKTTAPQTTRRDLRVLIAEDNRINQIVIVEILHNAGMKTKVVSNGQEASEAVKNETFDVVLMDCQMPQMDGYEATARIRSWEQSQPNALRLPIIALTANATQGDAEKCLQAGMDAYCKKPINQKQVLALIDHWTSEK